MEEKKNPVPKNFQKDNNTITGKSKSKKKTINVISELDSGAIGVGKREVAPKPVEVKETKKTEEDMVAIHSTKNVFWPGVGKILKGYNVVKREAADKWLTRNHTREATPEEIVREYGL